MATTSPAAILARHIRRGDRVAYGDGAGTPLSLGGPLAEAAAGVGEVSLLLGWSLELSIQVDRDVFADVASIIGGYALRAPLREGRVRYLPARLGTMPALLHGPLQVDHIIAGVRPARGGGYVFGSEVGWMRAAVDSGATVLAEVNHSLPDATDGVVLPEDRVVIASEVHRPPIARRRARSTPEAEKIGRFVADLIPEGASVQFGPGLVGEVVLASLQVPVRIHSGVLTDAVVDLDERGLLLDDPVSTYLAGSELLYRWADGKPI
ncbi:MAG: acetyl-CoA hydrolase, partial [Actinomycetota bacterium]